MVGAVRGTTHADQSDPIAVHQNVGGFERAVGAEDIAALEQYFHENHLVFLLFRSFDFIIAYRAASVNGMRFLFTNCTRLSFKERLIDSVAVLWYDK